MTLYHCLTMIFFLVLISSCRSDFCTNPLGVEDGTIPSEQLTASSRYNDQHGPHRGRLNTIADSAGTGAWSAGTNDQNQWIQADLGALKQITGVITQGRSDDDQWVTSYDVLYSINGSNFNSIIDASCDVIVFTGNSDQDTLITNLFPAPVYAQFIRIHPLSWHSHMSLRFEVIGCTDFCTDPLGVEDGTIPSEQLTASSAYSSHFVAERGRLNTLADSAGKGGWIAATKDQNQWIQADLGALKQVTRVITQGRSDLNHWVTSYDVLYSVNGSNFNSIMNASCDVIVFTGNSDRDTLITNLFPAPVYAQFVRIHPLSWQGRISLRFEVIGCAELMASTEVEATTEPTELMATTEVETTPEPTDSEFCINPLGVEDGTIPSEQLTASSRHDDRHGPHRSRLNTLAESAGIGAWAAGIIDQNQWIQADLGALKQITGVITQGRNAYNQWVTSYDVLYSVNGSNFNSIINASCDVIVFTGNSDQDTPITNLFPAPVYAQFIRIHPVSWHGWISLRFEVIGCAVICPDGWLRYEGSCYYFHPNLETFENGKRICDELDSGLVVINSQEENEFVYSQSGSDFYLGLHDKNIEGFFEWTVERSRWSDFTPWANNEPNNSGGNEDCGQALSSSFNDLKCSESLRICCETAPYLHNDPLDVSIVYERPLNLVQVMWYFAVKENNPMVMRCYSVGDNATSNIYMGTSLSLASYSTEGTEIQPSALTGENSDLPDESIASNIDMYTRECNIPITAGVGRFGEFTCRSEVDGRSTITHGITINNDANIKVDQWAQRTVTIGLGETVTLTVEAPTAENLRWRRNNKFMYGDSIHDVKNLTIMNARREDEGVYECYYQGQRHLATHAFMYLYVKECPTSYCGIPSCALNCPICYNGGQCDARSCTCICPPGFAGEFCETGISHGCFGLEGCSYNFTEMKLFCYPSPIGCSCPAGLTGKRCKTECVAPNFGTNCMQTCHCEFSCDRTVGCTDSSTCSSGFTGPTCLEYETDTPCPSGYFGEQCHKKCHCHDQEDCTKSDGGCETGCEMGWAGEGCQIALPALYFTPWIVVREENSVTISWRNWMHEHDFGVGPIVNYRIYLWDSWHPASDATPALVGVTNATTWEVTGLQESVEYSIMVRATKKISDFLVAGKSSPMLWISVYGQCDSGWMSFENQCFHVNNTMMSWNEADAYCKMNQSHLVHVTSVNIKFFVLHMLQTQQINSTRVFVGMNDKDDDGVFVWDGYNCAVRTNFSDTPDWHYIQMNTSNAHCVVVYVEDDFSLQKIACDDADMGIPVCQQSEAADMCIPVSQQKTCVDPLGVEDGSIPADQLSASSEKDDNHGAHRGRLNTQDEGGGGGKGAWKANTDDADQWIQADLSVVTEVTGIITQGRNGGGDEWVESYEVHHSVDGENFEIILGAPGEAEFSGNSDKDTAVTNMFNAAVHAQFIRIHPTAWQGHICLRFELLGCPEYVVRISYLVDCRK